MSFFSRQLVRPADRLGKQVSAAALQNDLDAVEQIHAMTDRDIDRFDAAARSQNSADGFIAILNEGILSLFKILTTTTAIYFFGGLSSI
jgi:hypothetical protein